MFVLFWMFSCRIVMFFVLILFSSVIVCRCSVISWVLNFKGCVVSQLNNSKLLLLSVFVQRCMCVILRIVFIKKLIVFVRKLSSGSIGMKLLSKVIVRYSLCWRFGVMCYKSRCNRLRRRLFVFQGKLWCLKCCL